MKTLIIRATSILAIPLGIALLHTSSGSTAYGSVSESTVKACESIPPARPTGGATAARLQVLQQCNNRLQQSTPTTESTGQPTTEKSQNMNKSNTRGCAIPPARPTGGGTTERLQAIQQCSTGVH
ncbi:hypothetical protein DP113_33245 (plasmid) [Brasilonema octagenarum UFV-E1]|uniref:Secreted protein n=2 Tax=Brasilonema TaxID=383614 RepID=A0A856MME2_9CYAN|nr:MULTISPECIES: hypothetical protein [Brasilonema]NMF61670.1 hypothetical protein [Brasilonema octagenarum UFV-OR1]QDL12605.1 hypothetical protein DP114_33140 [Brasilonema sennae CENA114]QDL19000.1 hypothetical protein DP113_33245 [Brasilonema octagenarum UFV-E1]